MSSASATISFPTVGRVEPDFADLRVVQEEYRHDVAVYTVKSVRSASLYRSGTPVIITWGDKNRANFCGYVHHFEPAGAGGGASRVWCRGASAVFDSGLRKSWNHRNVPSILAELGREATFDTEITGHGRVFSTVSATGERLWDFMVNQAKAIGYSFYCTNTRLQCRPRTALVERYQREAPVFDLEGSLYEFVPQDGAAAPGSVRANRVVTAQDRYGRQFEVVGGVAMPKLAKQLVLPSGKTYDTAAVYDPEEARWRVEALAELDRYHVHATATTEGDARVTQTWPVIMSEVGDRYNGLWFVKKVTHRVGNAAYVMELELGRDGMGSNIDIPNSRARRVLATRANPQGRPRVVYPPSVLNGGRWRAQWSAAARTFPEGNGRVR